MEHPATPSSDSKGNRGNRFVTPRRRKKSPGDALGSCKSQIPITRYYSSVSSSSEKGSQPLPSPKRRASGGSPRPTKRVRTKVSLDRPVIISSDDSSDDLFTDPRPDPTPPPALPLARLNHVKRCLYPETSSQSSSGKRLSRIKKKRLSKPERRPFCRKVRVLSSDDSCEEVPYTQMDPKPLQDPPQSSSQTVVRRNGCPDTLSQSILLSSSDDSDFELHNSKQSQSFASQSFSKVTPQLTQSFLSRQTIRSYDSARSSFAGSTAAPKVLSKRCSVVSNHNSAPMASTTQSSQSLQHVRFSSARNQKASVALSQLDETIDAHYKEDRSSLGPEIEFECVGNNSAIPPSPVENGLPSIYLQDTLPSSQHDVTQPRDKIDGSPKTPSGSSPESDPSSNIAQSVNSPSARQPLSCGPSIYDQETVDPAFNPKTMDLDETADVTLQDSTSKEPNANVLATTLQNYSLLGSRKGGVIDCSDVDLDESALMSDFGSKPNRTNLGAISLSELIDISHISGSDSDLPDDSFLDDECSIIDTSVGMFPRSPKSLSPQTASLLVENSDDSSTGITPILKALLDVSADFFSDVVSSFGTGGSGEDRQIDGDCVEGKDMQSDDADASRTDGARKGLAGIESVDPPLDPVSSSLPKVMDQQDLALDGGFGETLDSESLAEEPGQQDQTMNPHESSFPGAMDCLQEVGGTSALHQSKCSGVGDVDTGDDTPSTITGDESLGGNCKASQPKELAREETVDPAQLQTSSQVQVQSGAGFDGKPADPAAVGEPAGVDSSLDAKPAEIDSCLNAKPAELDSASAPYPGATSTTNVDVPNEIKIVCGSLPPETSLKLHIAQNLDKTLLYNPKQPLLLDTILSECQNYAESILNLEPIKTLIAQYSSLPPASKSTLHGCLLELLEDSNRWLKYPEASAGSIDNVVSSGILEYLNTNDNLITKLYSLTFYELSDILSKFGALSDPASECIETLRNTIFAKLTSMHPNYSVKKEVIDMLNRKFVKLTENASFCLKICLELFALPLNLNDKLYMTTDIARFANSLVREQILSKFSTLPLKTSKLTVDPGRVLSDLSELCRLKSKVYDSDLNDELIYFRVNDICSTIAVLDVSSEIDPVVKISPTFRFLVTNNVHALDDQLKKLFYVNCSDIEFGACIYLGFLLKQDVTGFQHKVKWCRERMRYLLKLLDTRNIFEEFSKTLKEPVSPVESIVRTEFVSNALKIKKLGLTQDEKFHLTKLLRPTVHARTQIVLSHLDAPLKYDVLTKKPKMKNFELVRGNIFEKFKSDFPSGVEDNGGLLMNAVFCTFWQTIYLPLEGAFVNKFQKSPLDWGSEQFFAKRATVITSLASEMAKHGLPVVLKSIALVARQFSFHRCVVDWNLVRPNLERIYSLVEALGLDRFLKIGVHLIGKLDERALGFPEMVLWNPGSKKVKFVGLKKPNDPLYPYQILWLEKLVDFGVEAEELHISGYIGSHQCSQLR